MTSYKKFLFATIAAAFLVPLGAAAQELEEEGEVLAPLNVNEIELGVGYSSEDSFKFGKFNGLEDEGAYFIGNIDVRKHRDAGSTDMDYWELNGRNLGLDGRSVYAEYARAGTFKIYADYDERINNLIDDGQTPFSGAGSTRLTLPSNWVPAGGVGSLTELFNSLNPVTISKEREKYGVGASWDFTDLWQIRANYHHENKDGTDEFGAIFGSSGGNPRGSLVPIPHEFEFDEFDVGLVYKGERFQGTLTYNLSIFDNQIRSLVFDNPFTNGGWAPQSSSAVGALVQGQVGNIFPDNDAWSINFSGGYNWSPRTRLTANLTYGEMSQDEDFLPYTSIPSLLDTGLQVPRVNLNGEIDNIYANVNLTHRFNSKLDAKVRFTYDERDNNTPRDVYARIAGDAQFQSSGTHRYNRPYSFERTKFEVEGSYRLPHMSKFTAGYTYEVKERDLQEVAENEEHSFHVKLNTMPAAWIGGWVKFQYSERDGGDNAIPDYYQQVLDAVAAAGFSVDPRAINVGTYFNNLPFLEGEDPAFIASEVAAFLANPNSSDFYGDFFEMDPLMRKFFEADRDRHQLSVNLNLYPNEEWSFGVLGKFANDEYDNSPLGVQHSQRSTLTFDVVYAPSDRFSANAFFTIDKNDYHQRGFERAGSQNVTVTENDRLITLGNNFWRIYNEDSVYTTGLNFDWNVIEDKFDLSLDMTYSDATTDITPEADNFATSTRLPAIIPFPDVDTRIYRIILKGDYKFREDWGSRVFYWYERYHSTDFALDTLAVNALANGGTGGNVILFGNQSPTYNAHVIGFSIYHEF